MYRLSYQDLLENGDYRNKIYCPVTYAMYDIRSKAKLTLDEILKQIERKYKTELCFLDCRYVHSISA